jgi:negative regulator of sigma E activity
MSCSFTEQVSYLIDGELPEAEARKVERHLLECPDCQLVRADFLNLRSQISSFESSASLKIQRRELAKFLSPSVRKEVVTVGPGWKWGVGPAAAAFAVLLLIAAIAGVFYLQRKDSVDPHGVVATASPSIVPSPSPTAVPSESPTQPRSDKPQSDKSQENKTQEPKLKRQEPVNPPKRVVPVREPKPGEQFASLPDRVRSADPQTMTAVHFEKTETLLRTFRNLRVSNKGIDIGYEKKRAQQLVYQNMMLRREADVSGDVQSAALLESVEPILLDIANLPDKADGNVVRVINERVERKNIVALLQVNGAALARALD